MVNATVETRKVLWSSAANRCAYPPCEQRLVADLRNPEDASATIGRVIGEEAHIRSSKPSGPRHDPKYTRSLDAYDNLILLCPTHHTAIDKDNGSAWSVEDLLQLKADHERRVDALLNPPVASGRVEKEAVLTRVARWEESLNVDAWDELTRRLNSTVPFVSHKHAMMLSETATWVAGITWPSKYPRLSAAFSTHGALLHVLVQHIDTSFLFKEDRYEVRRRHKETWFVGRDSEKQYDIALSEYLLNSEIVAVLITELTRTVNLVITAVNDEVDPLYRFEEGAVRMTSGDVFWGLTTSHPRFEVADWSGFPREYDLADIRSRVASEISGGDPRANWTLNITTFDASVNR
ncbi:hypothetical protein SAMN04487788_2354 [Microbacterium testaceum StLB037]|uniref:HNH nuclease domain-containing protein n=1 Tax=Microbacterium testaceum (strain StLB037) TaxID=979556 RepID=A0A1H0QIW4_MICTS|nr:HNH endonuclease [Microbacterium testaceum]SDP17247.1 hypothetical protein SAMN04487788_2354 [Microbacterium testaceum StLB037]